MKTRVLIVDDSALMRSLLSEIIQSHPDMEVVGAAPDPLVAREMIRALSPDVITLDVEMPKMDGLEFLEKLMRLRPTPVLMVSSLTERGSEITLKALELGAVDFITKPKLDIRRGMETYREEIGAKLRAARAAKMIRRAAPAAAPITMSGRAATYAGTEKVVLIGASTGGTEAIREVLTRLPADFPGILIAQHMPEGFTRSFAQRLNGVCRLTVKEAEHGERVLPGHAYVAPGHSHLRLAKSGANYVTALGQDPSINRHRPSVDALFFSAAKVAGGNALAAILTGMGRDGAAGLAALKAAGAHTLAQDEASCVVFGMPREAIALGAADEVVPLEQVAHRLAAYLGRLGQHAVRV